MVSVHDSEPTDFFHTKKINEKPINIITISDDRRIGVQFLAVAEYLSVLRGTIPTVRAT
jgi:hypothetical protein